MVAAFASLVGSPAGAGSPPSVRVAPVESGRASIALPGKKTLVVVSSLDVGSSAHRVSMREIRADQARPTIPVAPSRPKPAGALPPIPGVPPAATTTPPAARSFSLLVRDGDPSSSTNYATVPADLIGVGKRIQIYVDRSDRGGIDPALARDLIETFDAKVFPFAASRFGPAEDVDGDGRFTILLSSKLNRVPGGGSKVDGFVRGADLDPTLEPPFSNRGDMMYLNASLRPGPHARTVLAHEYTHAVVFSRRALDRRAAGKTGPDEEGWLDEGLAHLVEDLHGFSKSNIDYRVSAFLSRPERYRLVVEDYYSADLFRSHGNRGCTYLFLRWLVDRQGEDLVARMIRSDRRGIANLETATGLSFAELFREWSVALYLSGIEPEGTEDARFYRSIDTRGTIEDWILAGPRAVHLKAGRISDTWEMVGTSSRYAVVEGPTAIEIQGPEAARLQVSVVALPDDLGGVELGVRPMRGPDGTLQVRAVVADRGGAPVRLGAFSWESAAPTHDAAKSRGGLDMLGIARAFGGSALPPLGRKTSQTIKLGQGVEQGGPMVFKVVGTDAAGRRIAAWAEWSGGEEDE